MCEVMLTSFYDIEILKESLKGWNNFTTQNKLGLWHLENKMEKYEKKKKAIIKFCKINLKKGFKKLSEGWLFTNKFVHVRCKTKKRKIRLTESTGKGHTVTLATVYPGGQQ